MKTKVVPEDRRLSRVSLFFFNRPFLTAFLWIALTVFGAFSYTTLMRREGFPNVNFPLAIIGGSYLVDDASQVDSGVAGPITDIALQQVPEISSISTSSTDNFFSIQIFYESDIDARAATAKIEQAVQDSGRLPSSAVVQYNVPYYGATGGDVDQLDMVVALYDESGQLSLEQLVAKADVFADKLQERGISDVKEVFVKSPFAMTPDPASGELVNVQHSFDRFGIREDGRTDYYQSVVIGVAADDGFDVIKLDEAVTSAVSQIVGETGFENLGARVSASSAPQIKENISELQRSLLEGLIAILIVGSIVIAWRASIITVIAMITSAAITLGILHLVGYTLNVITLFSLILALALMVDDTIIMVEAIDAARHAHKDRSRVVREATRKISRAMVAATFTASLSFAPLLFVSGILGNFIRAIPITVISALLTSLIVALFFIPLFSRRLLLDKKHLGKRAKDDEFAAGFEAKIAKWITSPMLWARRSRKRLFAVGSSAVLIGLSFIVAGLLIARDVPFNIFPPTKDTNDLSISIGFAADSSLQQSQDVTDKVDAIIADELGENFEQGTYFASGSQQSAMQQIHIISYTKRDITSRQLVDKLQARFDSEVPDAIVVAGQVDISPPAGTFTVELDAGNRQTALLVAEEIKTWMTTSKLQRTNGTTANFTNPTVSGTNEFIRSNGKPVITVSAGFDADDTSALTSIAQTAVSDEFDADKLTANGLAADALQFELGFESDNQESFTALVVAFPIVLMVIYLLLALQFRSLLQPLLIFMAIPFSLFGIALGLRLTENAFSFFAMLGFFALLGLSIKNTILLTDYANQAHRAGAGVIDSAVEALRERFRPLFATSATAVVSLIPLAVTSPFWEGLMAVLIFGLLSSTLLVVTIFPYYYLGAEYLRQSINRNAFLIWLAVTVTIAAAVGWQVGLTWGLLIIPLSIIAAALQGFYASRLQ